MPWRQSDEAGPNTPTGDTLFEFLSLINAYLESAQELAYFIQGRVGQVATKRSAEIFFEKLNKPEITVMPGVKIDAVKHATLGAKPLGHRVGRSQRGPAKAADPTLFPHLSGQCPLAEHDRILGEDKAKQKKASCGSIWHRYR